MKILLKNIYMLFFKIRIIIYSKKMGKNCFIGARSDINKPKYITFSNNVRIGKDSRFSIYERFNKEKLNPSIYFGENVYIGNRFSILCADSVFIGDDVLIASDVLISTENHGTNPECELSYSKQSLATGKVRINNGVWIGEKVSILPNVCIGEKSIIGTGSVVTKNIPSYSIAVGTPAKVIKKYNFESHEWMEVI